MASHKRTALRPPLLDASSQLRRARELNEKLIRLRGYGLSEVPKEIFDLTNLEIIDFSENNLITVPERLWDLPFLRAVNVIGNPIESLPDRPGLTVDLPTYRRCYGQVKERKLDLAIGPGISEEDAVFWRTEIGSARNLNRLTIGHWRLAVGSEPDKPSRWILGILHTLSDLDQLQSLSIRGLRLGAVPESIADLRQLKSLSLDGLLLNNLPYWIAELNLERFSAFDNRLSDLPNSFRQLVRLKFLDLSFNSLGQIPEALFELTELKSLRLVKCYLREIPAEILNLPRLHDLNVSSNPIDSPPREVADKGLERIRDYWRQRADTGVDYLCEAKLIILGEAGAGKTSLAQKIRNPSYELNKREKSTEGIDVIRYQFPTAIRVRENGEEKALQREFQVNIWDFGGQEIYHATHQFFLTRRSVYVLVCDDRKEDTDFSYWLQVVELLSDASPLLIVQNEKQDRKRDINLSSLRGQFGNLCGALATNLDTNRGLDEVIQSIRKELETLPHVGVALPATWKRVREVLERDQRDYITLEQYLNICQKHGFTRRDDKLQLSGYLHDLGICLHFQDDPLLKNTVVLKPAWGTEAVYRVLDDPEVVAASGLFTRAQLDRIWFEPKYEAMQDELLQLMMKFQLCYGLDATHYIAPQLLSSEQPSYAWESTGGLVVRYEYRFLPKGIVTRFIVAMHHLIAGGTLVWKTGVVLEKDSTRAEIIEEYSQRRIRVRVSGADCRGLFAVVDEHLERLHAAFLRLQYERYLPCPCVECVNKAEPFGFALDSLIKMATKGQPIQCHSSGKMVDAERLVQEVLPGALRLRDYDPHSGGVTPVLTPPTPEVFVSYAWTTESNAIVDRLQEALSEHGIRLLRDREEVRYKDSIRDFMRRIGQGKAVVVVISEKYLKSESCMFEMVEIAKAQSLRERVFPIVMPDANIYKATGRVKYVSHWESEIRQLDDALKTVRADNLTNLHEDLDLYSEIRRLFDGIADTLRDMNALTPDQHEGSGFDELINRIRAQLGV